MRLCARANLYLLPVKCTAICRCMLTCCNTRAGSREPKICEQLFIYFLPLSFSLWLCICTEKKGRILHLLWLQVFGILWHSCMIAINCFKRRNKLSVFVFTRHQSEPSSLVPILMHGRHTEVVILPQLLVASSEMTLDLWGFEQSRCIHIPPHIGQV